MVPGDREVQNLLLAVWPVSISVSSSGPAVEKHSARLGQYRLVTNQTAQDRPVYKKTDRNYYIYYTSKLYYI